MSQEIDQGSQKETSFSAALRDPKWTAALVLVALCGIGLRLAPLATFGHVGFDEGLYRSYVQLLGKEGLFGYPNIVEGYIVRQRELPASILPPLRFLFIFTSWLWQQTFGGEALPALQHVARFFSILTFLLSSIIAFRLGGKTTALVTIALLACVPTQIHMAQYALADGFLTFWALLTLWLLWECLQQPQKPSLLLFYALSFALLVMTKENAFFVFVGIAGILAVTPWLALGTVTRPLLLSTFAGPLLGVCVLILLAGGLPNFIETYHLSVTKNLVHPYAIRTGDGPWYRYIVEFLLVNPLVLLLAVGEIFQLNKSKKTELFLFAFIAFSYLLMANLKYGMNLRYANMWDLPLCFLASRQILSLGAFLGKRRDLFVVLCVVFICDIELHQYFIIFYQGRLYEPVDEGILRTLNILKGPIL